MFLWLLFRSSGFGGKGALKHTPQYIYPSERKFQKKERYMDKGCCSYVFLLLIPFPLAIQGTQPTFFCVPGVPIKSSA